MIKVIDNFVKKLRLEIPLGVGELQELVRRRKQRNKETRAAHGRKEFPTYYTTEEKEGREAENQTRFLTYALSLIEKENRLYFLILSLRMRGASTKKISSYLSQSLNANISVQKVNRTEAEAVRYVKDKIAHLRRTGTPLFGEPGRKSSLILQGA